ncbi:hypothetical protein VDG1235_2960 [Verrucomicrobiia bacterium DG1235]|nr:hypothetical protein VDG1235_2960 [Verrucomicrobiae bacterium DG1235]
MNSINSIRQRVAFRITKVCLCCFVIAGATVLASGFLKLGLLNNDQKLAEAFAVFRPINESLQQIVERSLY